MQINYYEPVSNKVLGYPLKIALQFCKRARFLFPFHGARRLGGDVVDYAVDVGDLVCDAV